MTISKPVITTHPQSRNVPLGGLLHLTATLNDPKGCTFQWAKNGTALKGETDDDYIMDGATIADAGDYTVTITSAGGRTVSNKATITVGAVIPAPPQVNLTTPAGSVVLPRIMVNYPQAATLVPPGGDIQAAAAMGPVRLGVGSYSGTITMRPGQQLYGMPGTDCTGLTINMPDGSTGIVLSGLLGGTVNCTGSVKGNVFRRLKFINVNVRPGCTFDSNLLCGFTSGLDILGGDWMNNRVVGQTKHSSPAGVYDCTIQSGADRKSINNVLLWRTMQSLPKSILMSGQGDLAIVGLDVEDTGSSLVDGSDNGTLRAFNLNGGTGRPNTSGFNLGADELQIIGGSLGLNGPTVISSGLKRLLTVNFSASVSGSPGAVYNETSSAALLAPLLAPVRTGSPWERPALPGPTPVPDAVMTPPTGYTDSTATIQAAVNGSGFLPVGTFYVDGTILLRKGQVLIGAGEGRTVIVATNSSRDIFQVNLGGTVAKVSTGAVHLSDMTLAGGAVHLHFNTPGDQANQCTLSHVTFWKAAVAGLSVDMIYGMDNNFFDALNFVNCTTGVLQLPDPNYSGGETPTMAYVDKTVFYGCQFIACGKGADMQAGRPDNLDAFIYSVFAGNGSVGKFSAHNALMFANCDLVNSGLLQSQAVSLVSCNFGGAGPFLTGNVTAEGCAFGGSGAAFMSPGNVVLLNSRPGGMTLAGRLLNCNNGAVPQLLLGVPFA